MQGYSFLLCVLKTVQLWTQYLVFPSISIPEDLCLTNKCFFPALMTLILHILCFISTDSTEKRLYISDKDHNKISISRYISSGMLRHNGLWIFTSVLNDYTVPWRFRPDSSRKVTHLELLDPKVILHTMLTGR